MELQGRINIRHDGGGKAADFSDQTQYINRPGLVGHDFRAGLQASIACRNIDFEGVYPLDVGSYGAN